MGKVVGIRFSPQGKIYDFDPGAYVLSTGDNVIVETEQGLGFGTVAAPVRQMSTELLKKPLKKIHRLANYKDLAQHDRISELEKEAFDHCEKQIAELGLKMRLFSVDSTFDSNKLTFFFTADGRVDFRELVKLLVRHYRVRIELRQIGVRHQARMCGGIGRCGREICCSSFMPGFIPVSVKMAKVQNLSLNPTKISGLCGRLMCCLTFEHETYKKLREGLPKIGKIVSTPSGKGKVLRHNLLKSLVLVRVDGQEMEFDMQNVSLAKDQDLRVKTAQEKKQGDEKKRSGHGEKRRKSRRGGRRRHKSAKQGPAGQDKGKQGQGGQTRQNKNSQPKK